MSLRPLFISRNGQAVNGSGLLKFFFCRFFHFYFRYGREDEEVMGLRFCNEAIMSLHQIWPRLEEPTPESLSPLQVILWNYA